MKVERPILPLLALVLFCLPLVKGGNRDWYLLLVCAGIFLVAAYWLALIGLGLISIEKKLIARLWPLGLIWALWLLYQLAQMLPLAAFFPDVFDGRASLPGDRLTVSYTDTWRSLVYSAALAALFFMIATNANTQLRRERFALCLVIAGVFQAIYGVVIHLAWYQGWVEGGAQQVHGALGTFANRNHFAGFLSLTGALAIGLVLAGLGGHTGESWRARFRNLLDFLFSRTALLRVLVAVMVIALVLSRSRMGNFAFFNALAVCGVIYLLLRGRQNLVKGLVVLATFFIVDLLILGKWFGLDALVQRIQSTQLENELRVDVFPDLMRALDAYWPLGSGAGTFYTAFPPFRSEEIGQLHYYAHNDFMQFAIEVGLPGLLLLGGIVGYVALYAFRLMVRRRNPLVAGIAFAGLMSTVSLGLHSTTDFNLQIPACSAMYVAILALVMSCSSDSSRQRTHRYDS